MSTEHVLTMLHKHKAKFINLRVNDTKSKEQRVTI
jgi:hypothetical protein